MLYLLVGMAIYVSFVAVFLTLAVAAARGDRCWEKHFSERKPRRVGGDRIKHAG